MKGETRWCLHFRYLVYFDRHIPSPRKYIPYVQGIDVQAKSISTYNLNKAELPGHVPPNHQSEERGNRQDIQNKNTYQPRHRVPRSAPRTPAGSPPRASREGGQPCDEPQSKTGIRGTSGCVCSSSTNRGKEDRMEQDGSLYSGILY